MDMLFFCFELFFLYSFSSTTEVLDPPVELNATVDSSLSIDINLWKTNNSTSKATAFKIFFTNDSSLASETYKTWRSIELLTSQDLYHFRLDGKEYDIQLDTIYRFRATIYLHHVESIPSRIIYVNTLHAAPLPPVIQSAKMLNDSMTMITFIPGEDITYYTNYTLEYCLLDMNDICSSYQFESDDSNRIFIDNLSPNTTYSFRLFVSGSDIVGRKSNQLVFQTSQTEKVTKMSMSPSEDILFDPDLTKTVEITCTAYSTPPPEIEWSVNGQSVHLDHSFYTITSSVLYDRIISVIRAKSRTRSDELTCTASNSAGDESISVKIQIRGPGSPPSTISLDRDRSGYYNVQWRPPSHPNGNITKYVVYHSLNKDDPLSDWQQIGLDGKQRKVRIASEYDDGFYVRIQAANQLGPGIISDIVAIERDTQPISVNLTTSDHKVLHRMIISPGEKIRLRCVARGKPRPSLFYAISSANNESQVMVDVWQSLKWKMEDEYIIGSFEVSILTSKNIFCRAKNSAGSNSSLAELVVLKPGDSPIHVQVLNVDSRDVTTIWDPPLYPNSLIKKYEIQLTDDPEEDENNWIIYETEGKDRATPLTRFSIATDELKPSTQYYVRVRAINDEGAGPFSPTISFTTPNGGPDGIPTGVRVEMDESNTAILSWKPPNSTAEVLYYTVYYTRDLGISNDDYKDWQLIQIPATSRNKYKLDYQVGLKPKTFYRIRLCAKNDIAEGPPSETAEFETSHSQLPIPTDIRTEVSDDNTLHIMFAAVRDPEDHAKAIENYKLEISTNEDFLQAEWSDIEPNKVEIDPITSQVDIWISGQRFQRNTMHWIRIRAVLETNIRIQPSKPRWFRTKHGKLKTRADIIDGDLVEKEPNILESFTIKCHAEGSPAPLIQWKWNGQIIINSTDGWSIKDEIEERNTRSELTRNSIKESGLIHCYAHNDEGEDEDLTEFRVLGPGSPPYNIITYPYKNYINISWNQPIISNGNITKYLIYYSTRATDDLSDWKIIEWGDTNAELPVISSNTIHYIQIQGVSQYGPGIISDRIECMSDERYEALNISIHLDTVANGISEPKQQIQFICNAKGSPRPRVFYSWDGEEDSEANTQMIENENISTEKLNLYTPKNKTIKCRAANKFEEISIRKDIIVRRPGDAPINITWLFEDNDSLFITWNKVIYPNGNETYIVYLSNLIERVSGPPVRIPDLPYNINITLRISAENEWGEGERSLPITIITPNGGPKDSPTVEDIQNEDENATITWSSPKKPAGIIKEYTLYIRQEDEEEWRVIKLNASIKSYTFYVSNILPSDNVFEFRISATNEINEGPKSEIVFFNTFCRNELFPPSNISAYLVNTTLIINIPQQKYKKYAVHLRPLYSSQYTRHYVGIPFNNDQYRIYNLPIENNIDYAIKVNGIVGGKDTEKTEEIQLKKMDKNGETNEKGEV